MFKLNNSTKCGLTLLELVIAMFLMGILTLSIAVIHISGQKRFLVVEKKVRLLNQTNYVIDHITRNVRECKKIVDPKLDAKGSLARLETFDNQEIVYTRLGNNQVKFISPAGSEVLAKNIIKLEFTHLENDTTGAKILYVYITAEDRGKSVNLEQYITLRNPED